MDGTAAVDIRIRTAATGATVAGLTTARKRGRESVAASPTGITTISVTATKCHAWILAPTS